MHGSVVGVGRVVASLDQSEEGMTVRRVEAKVADQTWWDQLGHMVVAEHIPGPWAIPKWYYPRVVGCQKQENKRMCHLRLNTLEEKGFEKIKEAGVLQQTTFFDLKLQSLSNVDNLRSKR